MPIEITQVQLKIDSQKLKDEFIQVFKNLNGFNITDQNEKKEPDLLIYELNADYNTDLEKIKSYIEKTNQTEVFLFSKRSEPEVIIKALQIGAKEFFQSPYKDETIIDALGRFRDRQKKSKQKISEISGKVISIFGSKGGVGTTTVAVNLAVSIAKQQAIPSVVLLDMNIIFGEVPIFLDMSPKHHWGDITKNIDRLDEFFLSNILTKHDSGVHILPSPKYLSDYPPPTPPVMETLLNLIKENFEYVIIDLGQSINETALRILQNSDLIQIVTIQTLPCLSNTNRLIKIFLEYGHTNADNLGIILNRYYKKGMVSIESAEEGIGRKMSWVIPNDYLTTMSAINSGQPLCQIAPRSKIVTSYDSYTEKKIIKKKRKRKKRWFF